MKARVVSLICCFLVAGSCFAARQRPAAAQNGADCWLVYWISTGENPGDMPDEIICLTSQTTGQVRESSIFGSGVKGCNRVTVGRKGGGMTLTVDYSKCSNNSPSHTISCPAPSGSRLKCQWTMADKSHADANVAYLVPEKR
jgi:hypothetical protein